MKGMTIIALLVAMFLFAVCRSQTTCGTGMFGKTKCYQCNCKKGDTCDADTGKCSTRCKTGYAGPTCQMVNMIRGRGTNQSSTDTIYVSGLAVEGSSRQRDDPKTPRCSKTAQMNPPETPWWYVELEEVQQIWSMTLYNYRQALNLIVGFEIYVSNSSKPEDWNVGGDATELCFKDKSGKGKRTYSINCGTSFQPIHGQFIAVKLPNPGVLHFCELMVYRCENGWYGQQCEEECLNRNCRNGNDHCGAEGTCKSGCLDGWHGKSCATQCSDGCNVCDQMTGRCNECKAGRYGEKCSLLCNNTARHCLDSNDCNKDGDCLKGCLDGWHGRNCSLPCHSSCVSCNMVGECDKCEDGYYGTYCEMLCNNTARHCSMLSDCNKDGSCSMACSKGWSGDNCSFPCSNFCDECDKQTGNCLFCKSDRYGVKRNCDANSTCVGECEYRCSERHCVNNTQLNCSLNGYCSLCEAGWFGKDCSKQCSSQCVSCNKMTGVCDECRSGFHGPHCRLECPICRKCYQNNGTCLSCPSNKYNMNCTSNCLDRHCLYVANERCPLDGFCGNCTDGWYGVDCTEVCDVGCLGCDKATGQCVTCKDGYYGNNCNRSCSNCETCDRNSGSCITCSNRTYGDNCTEQCEERRCRDPDFCPLNGSCASSCQDGYYGSTCTSACTEFSDNCSLCTSTGCTKCSFQYYGNSCNNTCPVDCSECNGTRESDLVCSQCLGNKFGTRCERDCSSFCKQSKCMASNGNCKYGCTDGRYGRFCQYSCSLTCGRNKNDAIICDQNDGRCSFGCVNSQYGDTCNLTCSVHCAENGSCHPKTGLCADGCADGYYGRKCDKTCSQQCHPTKCDQTTGSCITLAAKDNNGARKNSKLLIIISAASGLFIIAVIIVIVIIVARRRSKAGGEVPYERSTIADAESKSFENLVMEELGDDIHIDTKLATTKVPDYNDETLVSQGRHMSISTFKGASTSVNLSDLWPHVLKMKALDLFRQQHEKLPSGLKAECTAANNFENASKNRFADCVAYDHSRVVLKEVTGNPHSDYINANYINGYDREKVYIASQGPMANTIDDFLRMLWQVKSDVVITLTESVEDGKVKCEKYWPDNVTETKKFTEFSIYLASIESHDGFSVRIMDLIQNDSWNSINFKQFHYTDWPDHGVPKIATSLITFHDLVKPSMRLNISPTVVHCSAGIGRSGTFIALDYLLAQGSDEGVVDVFKCVKDLRSQRVNMVPKVDQYIFLHEALIEAFHLDDTCIRLQNFSEQYELLCETDLSTGESKLNKLYESLDDLTPDRKECDFRIANSWENQKKNRSKNILASDYFRPYLTTIAEGCNDYINALFMPKENGISTKIITQTPLPDTVIDFWRMVYEQECSTIVMMHSEHHLDDRDVGVYWLNTKPEETVGPFVIKKLYSQENNIFKVNTLKLTCVKEMAKDAMHVKQFIFNAWPEMVTVPPSQSAVLFLLKEIKEWQAQTSCPLMIVHCMNGADRSGLLCAVDAVLNRIERDKVVSIPEIIVTMRYRRDLLIRSLDQFQFCYEAVKTFIEEPNHPEGEMLE